MRPVARVGHVDMIKSAGEERNSSEAPLAAFLKLLDAPRRCPRRAFHARTPLNSSQSNFGGG